MRQIVGTTVVNLDLPRSSRPVIQNLGPGVLYLDSDPDVTVDSGLQLPVGAVYEFFYPLAGQDVGLSLISSLANTDVRVLVNGDV